MASKSQIALPDLSDRHWPEGKSAPRHTTASQQKSQPARRRANRKSSKPGKADVIPAFLPKNEDELQNQTESSAPEDEQRDSGTPENHEELGLDGEAPESKANEPAVEEHDEPADEEDAAPCPASAADDEPDADSDADAGPADSDGDKPDAGNGGGIDDPELIALLEQLSATIDNANQMLAESPPLVGPVTKLYSGADAPATPEQPAPAADDPEAGAPIDAGQTGVQEPEAPLVAPPSVSVEKLRGPGRRPALLATGLFLLAVGGGYWWISDNPSLFDGWRGGDTILALSQNTDPQHTVGPGESIGVKMPVPAVDVPLPPRAPRPGATVTEREPGTASPAPLNEPPADEESVPITEMLAKSPPPTSADDGKKAPARGPAGQAIDLGLTVPAEKQGYEISVMIQGVPEGAELSKGSKIGGGTWILEEKDVAGLALVTPASFEPRDFAIEVAFVKSDGKIPESRNIDVVVEPADAPVTPATHGLAAADAGKAPPALATASVAARGPAPGGTASQTSSKQAATAAADPAPSAEPSGGQALTREEEEQFLARGRDLLQLGDIASARLVLGHAAQRGSRAAMLALGKTYDPQHLAELGVQGVQPDMNQAKAWYERASRKADR